MSTYATSIFSKLDTARSALDATGTALVDRIRSYTPSHFTVPSSVPNAVDDLTATSCPSYLNLVTEQPVKAGLTAAAVAALGLGIYCATSGWSEKRSTSSVQNISDEIPAGPSVDDSWLPIGHMTADQITGQGRRADILERNIEAFEQSESTFKSYFDKFPPSSATTLHGKSFSGTQKAFLHSIIERSHLSLQSLNKAKAAGTLTDQDKVKYHSDILTGKYIGDQLYKTECKDAWEAFMNYEMDRQQLDEVDDYMSTLYSDEGESMEVAQAGLAFAKGARRS